MEIMCIILTINLQTRLIWFFTWTRYMWSFMVELCVKTSLSCLTLRLRWTGVISPSTLYPIQCWLMTHGTESNRTLPWRHNGRDSVSNHQPHHCLLNCLFGRRSKKTSKLRVTGLCVGNSPGPVNSPHKWPVTRKMFPFDDVIMNSLKIKLQWRHNEPDGISDLRSASRLFTQRVYSGADQRKHQSSASLAFVLGIHRWPVKSPHKGPVTRKMFSFDDVIMICCLSSKCFSIYGAGCHRQPNLYRDFFSCWIVWGKDSNVIPIVIIPWHKYAPCISQPYSEEKCPFMPHSWQKGCYTPIEDNKTNVDRTFVFPLGWNWHDMDPWLFPNEIRHYLGQTFNARSSGIVELRNHSIGGRSPKSIFTLWQLWINICIYFQKFFWLFEQCPVQPLWVLGMRCLHLPVRALSKVLLLPVWVWLVLPSTAYSKGMLPLDLWCQASLQGLPERQHLGKTVHCWGWSDRIVSWVLGPWRREWETCTEWGLVAQRLTTDSCPVVTGHIDPQRSPCWLPTTVVSAWSGRRGGGTWQWPTGSMSSSVMSRYSNFTR